MKCKYTKSKIHRYYNDIMTKKVIRKHNNTLIFMYKCKSIENNIVERRLFLQITIHCIIFKTFGGKFNKNVLECLKIIFHYLFTLVSYINHIRTLHKNKYTYCSYGNKVIIYWMRMTERIGKLFIVEILKYDFYF